MVERAKKRGKESKQDISVKSNSVDATSTTGKKVNNKNK